MKAVKRASSERDLLCPPWRGRVVVNSLILQLDESTVNAGSNKNKEGGRKEKRKEKWGRVEKQKKK